MRLDANRIGSFAARAFGLPVEARVAEEPLAPERLSGRERIQLAGLACSKRAESWRLGRAALKDLRTALGESPDTADLSFPHPRYSLSHCGRTALAVGCRIGGEPQGIGVDLERDRPVPSQAARFFLTPAEQLWLADVCSATRSAAVLRLWTVKEALFKADPGNAETRLHHYGIELPFAPVGRARNRRGMELRYASLRADGGFVSVAVSD